MSSTAVKKAKTVARTKTKRSLAERDVTPASSSKGHKPKLTKGEEHTDNTKSKPVRGEGTKRATSANADEETRHKTISDTRNHAKRAARPERKLRGPWRAPSPSPSLSPTSDFEPSLSEEDESDVPQEEDSPDKENVHLYGFSTDEDSSDDDLDVDDEAVCDVGTLPTVARDDATVKRKLERAKRIPVRVSSHHAPRAVNMTHCTRSSGNRNGCSLSEPDSPWLL
jgi:nucleolar protein 15